MCPSLRWTGGCTHEEGASRRSGIPSTALCSPCSAHLVLGRRKKMKQSAKEWAYMFIFTNLAHLYHKTQGPSYHHFPLRHSSQTRSSSLRETLSFSRLRPGPASVQLQTQEVTLLLHLADAHHLS